MIKGIQKAITPGIKLFKGHNSDNSTSGRSPVGEVLTSFTKEIGGKLRTIAVACMERADALLYDVCSIEANVYENNGVVGDIENVTGIAVANSRIEQPAFKSAKRMQVVQCFDEADRREPPSGEDRIVITLEDLNAVPMELIKAAVNQRNMHPSQLFDIKALEADREFGAIVKAKTDLEAQNVELTTKLTESQEKFAGVEKIQTQSEVKTLFETKLAEKVSSKKISEKQKEFISNRFDATKFEKADDASIDGFFESEQKEFQTIAKMFGGESGNTGTDESGEDGNGEKSINDEFNDA